MQRLLTVDVVSDARFTVALAQFVRIETRRQRYFEALAARADTDNADDDYADDDDVCARSRLFALSDTEQPWRVFEAPAGATSRLQWRSRCQRLAYEWSNTHVSALHSACASGDRQLVRALLLVSNAASPIDRTQAVCTLARDCSGRIPLHHAAMHEQHKVVRLLLQRPDAALQARVCDNMGYTSAHYVLAKLAALTHRYRYQQRASPASVNTATMRAASKRYRRLWRSADLLVAAARIQLPLLLTPAASTTNYTHNRNALDSALATLDLRCRGDAWDAVRTGDLERLQFLFYGGSIASHTSTTATPTASVPRLPELRYVKRSLLHEACDQQQVPTINFLVTHLRASVLEQDAAGCTPLHVAAIRSCLEACVILLNTYSDATDSAGYDSDALCLSVDARGRTPLHASLLAKKNMHSAAPVASFLAHTCVAALHVRDADSATPLHFAISRGDVALVRLFVELGASVNAAAATATCAARARSGSSCRATASWAPCGARFHGPSKAVTTSVVIPVLAADRSTMAHVESALDESEAVGATEPLLATNTTHALSACGGRDDIASSNSYNHDVLHTLRYWLHAMPSADRMCAIASADCDAQSVTDMQAIVPARHTAAAAAAIATEHADELERQDVPDSSDALGCSKYGGSCRLCASDASDIYDGSDALSPLVTAIRECSRCCRAAATSVTSEAASTADRPQRWQIVEYLLAAGADPDGTVGYDVCDSDTSPLEEALGVSTVCPQALSLLLTYGASRSRAAALERFCLAAATARLTMRHDGREDDSTRQAATERTLEAVLPRVLSAATDEQLASLVSVLFATRCFNVLLRLRLSISSSSERVKRSVAAVPDSDCVWLWHAVLRGLTQPSATQTPKHSRTIQSRLMLLVDCEHLTFLCECAATERLDSQQYALISLLHACLHACFAKWRHASHDRCCSAIDSNNKQRQQQRERIVAQCLDCLRVDSPVATDATTNEFDVATWIDCCVALQFFDCALKLVASQLKRNPHARISLDRVLQALDNDVVAHRRHYVGSDSSTLGCTLDEQQPRAFVLALLDTCFAAVAAMSLSQLADRSDSVRDDPATHTSSASSAISLAAATTTATVSTSMQLVVRVCAHNVPLDAMQQVLALAGSTLDWTVAGVTRVRGRTLAEWLVHHACTDVMQLVLDRCAHQHDDNDAATQLWKQLVCAAATASPLQSAGHISLLAWLLARRTPVSRELPLHDNAAVASSKAASAHASSSPDHQQQQLWHVLLDRAVRCDSVLLFQYAAARLWSASTCVSSSSLSGTISAATYATEASRLLAALVHARVFHAIARWNALQVAAYALATCASNDLEARRSALLLAPTHTPETANAAEPSPLDLCYALGHVELAALLLAAVSLANSSSSDATLTQSLVHPPHGLLTTIVRLNAASHAVPSEPRRGATRLQRTLEHDGVFAATTARCMWHTACALDLVTHLDALALHRVPVIAALDDDSELPSTSPSLLVMNERAWCALALVAITNGALHALQWLLRNRCSSSNSSVTKQCAPADYALLYKAASKHTSDVFARMTLLLLEYDVPYTARLAGDGADATLLHCCARFANTELAQQLLARVCALLGSSVDVLDGAGLSPIAYALASGQLATASALIGSSHARLENEYEGQSCMYYTLQLAPSFTWRWALQRLLTDTCDRRYLHCVDTCGGNDDGDGDALTACGCKGFERCSSADTGAGDAAASTALSSSSLLLCSFCGHDAIAHSKVPLPPWFADQYETYCDRRNVEVEPRDCDSDDYSDNATHQCTSDAIDDVTLENERGRLNVAALTAIATLRFTSVLEQHSIHSAADDNAAALARSVEDALDSDVCAESPAESSSCSDEGISECGWTMFPLHCLDDENDCNDNDAAVAQPVAADIRGSVPRPHGRDDDSSGVDPCSAIESLNTPGTAASTTTTRYRRLPWHLQADVAAMHAPSCRCHVREFATSEAAWTLQIITQWLRYTAEKTLMYQQIPLRSITSRKWVTRLAFVRWRQRTAVLQATARSQRVLECLAGTAGRVHTMQQFVSHWRFARAFAAFQRWKHAFASAAVRHMQLAAALERIVAQMQQSRLELLRGRHTQLLRSAAVAMNERVAPSDEHAVDHSR